MLLTKMILQDIGVYNGYNKFDFEVKPDKPIVLYGGTNGSGKTTLFESISLCLYGKDFGEKIKTKQYHEKIHKLFHRCTKTRTSAKEASVTLEFQFAQSGNTNQYKIKRVWQNNDGKIDEFLHIAKKLLTGKKYTQMEMEESQLQLLINQMIPKDIASMFFFDGEKIQNIAQSGNENIHIKSSFDSLLGLNLPSQLGDAINLYILRNSDEESKAVLAELDRSTEEKKTLEKKLEQTKEKRIFLAAEISRRHKELETREEKFFKIGGNFAKKRQQLINKKTETEKSLASIENNIRVIIEKDLPLAFVADQLRLVKKELESDAKKIKTSFEKDTIDQAFITLLKEFQQVLSSYPKTTQDDIHTKLHGIMDKQLESLSDVQKLTFDFSLSEMNIVVETIDSILNEQFEYVFVNRDLHKRYLMELEEINIKLDVTPQQDEVGPLYSEIKSIAIEIGEMDQELQTLEGLEAQEKSLIVILNARIRKSLVKKKTDARKIRGLEMAPKIQDVLEDYAQRLRMKKIELLESNILEGIRRCFHKDRLIVRISIDPQTYDITLYGTNDDEITKEQLSQGELQMYATAIVWGLAKTSGRPLPFIIDTPLARLDEKHRENLITSFYPTASHQTIIFSTNTEIIDSYFELLKPHISQAWLIQYDATEDKSLVSDGYFDGGRLVAV